VSVSVSVPVRRAVLCYFGAVVASQKRLLNHKNPRFIPPEANISRSKFDYSPFSCLTCSQRGGKEVSVSVSVPVRRGAVLCYFGAVVASQKRLPTPRLTLTFPLRTPDTDTDTSSPRFSGETNEQIGFFCLPDDRNHIVAAFFRKLKSHIAVGRNDRDRD
jgi:hypothetical protein